MKKRYLILFLTTILLSITALAAGDGNVDHHQKISDTEGGFTGTLANSDRFGSDVASIGDLDNDGIEDIAVGASLDDDGGTDRGAVWVLLLNANGSVKSYQKISDTEGNFTGVLADDDYFGFSVAPIGDLDNDGVEDIAVGAYGDDDGGTDRGAFWILFLNSTGGVKNNQKISDTEGSFTGTLEDNLNFGSSLTSIGDLDNDSIGDLAVGAENDDQGGGNRGAVWVLFLNSNGTVKNYQKISDTEGNFTGVLDNSDSFGSSVASIGDLNGDSVEDIAVGALFDDDGGSNRGAVWILFLNLSGGVKSYQKISDTEGNFTGTFDDWDSFGSSVAYLGDLDGDSVGDLVVGAEGDDDGGSNRGAAWVLFLNSNGTVKSHQKISDTAGNFTGVLDNGDEFGGAATSLDDLNGDGIDEIIVGAKYDDDGSTDRGAVWILFANGTATFTPPTMIECDGIECSDLSGMNAVTIQSVSDFIWHGANRAVVKFLSAIDFSGYTSLDDVVEVGPRSVSIDADNAASMNISANVSFTGIGCNNFNLYYATGHLLNASSIINSGTIVATQDNIGGDCLDSSLCGNITCADSTLNFTAGHFDSFGVEVGAGTPTSLLKAVTDKLNFWNVTSLSQEKNHTVTITWEGSNYTGTQTVYFVLPESFNFSNGYQDDLQNNCGNSTSQGFADSDVVCYCDSISRSGNCSYNSAQENVYKLLITPQNPNLLIEQTIFTMLVNTSNGSDTYSPLSNLKFLKLNDNEIWHTLVEFGRGRGNYFYDTFAEGVAGSGHTGQACNAVPANSLFELNYLHKVLNIKQYFGLFDATATQATFTCTYPNMSIVRQHLPIEITRDPTWNISYLIPEIEGSWERSGYVGQDFDIYETPEGTLYNVNCTNLNYILEGANGNVTVEKDNFFVEARSTNPLIINGSADPLTPIVGNGTQEILFTYNITNNETYEIRDVLITIKAPQYSQFIGVRAELWGVARDRYTLQLARIKAGDSVLLTLAARFNTTDAPPGVTALNTSDGIEVKFNPCWEVNAYNPNEYFQGAAAVGSIPLDMSLNASILNFQSILTTINQTIININTTLINITGTIVDINNTVNNINTTLYNINTTVNYINSTLVAMNSTFDIRSILGNLSLMINLTSNLNTTLQNNMSDILNAIRDINGSLVSINQTLYLEIQNLSFNIQQNFTSIFANLSLILQKIDNISVNTSADIQSVNDSVSLILSRVQRLQEFDEELVFLVTDSFGLVQQAASAISQGDEKGAMQKLEASNEKLAEASTRLLALQQTLQGTAPKTKTDRLKKIFTLILGVLIILALIAGIAHLRNKNQSF